MFLSSDLNQTTITEAVQPEEDNSDGGEESVDGSVEFSF